MNRIHESSDDGLDPRLLDRLADGELSEAAERELLARLDGEPDGWRRLALAFVEQQHWRRELRALAAESAGAAETRDLSRMLPECRAVEQPASRRTGRRRAVSLAVAGIVAAFLLGLLLGGLRPTGDSHPVAGTSPEPSRPPVEQESEPTTAARPLDTVGPDTDQALPLFGVLRLVVHDADSGTASTMDVPLVELSATPADWLTLPPSQLPEAVRKTLKRRSYEVVERRRLYPLELEDGRRVVLVDREDVEVRYAGSLPL